MCNPHCRIKKRPLRQSRRTTLGRSAPVAYRPEAEFEDMSDTDTERYEEAPIKRFVDIYVMAVIGALPAEIRLEMDRLDLQSVFKTKASEWRQVLRETLALSETFDTAILDLWFRWTDAALAEEKVYPPEQFAAGFTDNYFAEDSKIDVWLPGALEAAHARISAALSKH